MLFPIALDAATPNLFFLFGVFPILLGIAVVALAVYLIVRTIKKKRDKYRRLYMSHNSENGSRKVI